MLTYQYGHRVSEAEVFTTMYAKGDKAKIRAEGFSLLDMRRYLQSQGFVADGFELPLDKLFEEGLPAIVLLNDRGYRHFVVVKGMRGGRVLIGDPARGTRAMSRRRFEQLWDNRVLFVVHNRRELAQFNHPRDWKTAPPAPMEMGVQREGLRQHRDAETRPGRHLAMKQIARVAWIVCALLLTGSDVVPDQTQAQGDRLGSDWVAMTPQKLDRMRGGFVLPSGLLLSFGIERAVYVNGELVATANYQRSGRRRTSLPTRRRDWPACRTRCWSR